MCLGHDLAVKVVLQQQPHHGCGRADPGKLHRIFVTSMTVLWLYGSCVTPTPVPLRPRIHKVPYLGTLGTLVDTRKRLVSLSVARRTQSKNESKKLLSTLVG
jgi:hypothetical protein